jgi:tetratricopeptide (TPR) repeat protein
MRRKILVPMFVLLLSRVAVSSQGPANATSPAERRVNAARKAIAEHPEKYQPYNDLGLALARRMRETSDPGYYAQAEAALKQSFRLVPGNFEGRKLQVLLLLGRCEYARARQAARELNRQMPDDVLVWGYLADADIGLGDYEDAERNAQWMLDLRPGNIPGLVRGARLRTLYGDLDGAMDFLKEASFQTPPTEVEDLAWYASEMANLELTRGQASEAAKLFSQALQLFPGYCRALEGMARVKMAQHEFAAAVGFLQQRNRVCPHPEDLLLLAQALEKAGRRQEAEESYSRFEAEACARLTASDNANRELVFYYVDEAHQPEKALRIAQLEISRRHDIETLHAYAWALYANGELAQARRQLESALAVGVRDAVVLYHAGVVASALDDQAAAPRFFKQSLDLNPYSDVAAAAHQALDSVPPASAKPSGR